MTDGIGTMTFSYKPVGANGALQIASEVGPLSTASISYGYDALGRPVSRTIAGSSPETYGYDALGRLTSHVNGLGAFTYAYLGQTAQMTSKSLGGTSLSSTWSYGSNLQDRRLTAMTNAGIVSGQHVDFGIDTDVLGRLTSITQNTDAVIQSTSTTTQTGQFNALNQQTLVGTQVNTYDALGQLTSDGVRNYSWDAEGQLVGITYPSEPGKSTLFSYDGMGRRVGILSTPAGGGSTLDRRFVWCGSDLCQSRDPTGLILRDYLAEGEKAGAQSFYYAQDHQGSVRRAFTTGTSPAYDYDPYGTQIQTGAPVTDFTYAGLMALPEAGIYLSQTRPYNPGVGRWLRRDMAGEGADADGNLYGYANKDSVNNIDPRGDVAQLVGAAFGGLVDGGLSAAFQYAEKGCINWSQVGSDAALGAGIGFVTGGVGNIVKAARYAPRITGLLEKIAFSSNTRKVTVFRVEGSNNSRFAINSIGNISIEPGTKTIWLNFGQEGRAFSYLERKISDGLPGAHIKSFDVDAKFLERIRSAAVPENVARRSPGSPIISRDPFPDQYGLKPEQFQDLMNSFYKGSGRYVVP